MKVFPHFVLVALLQSTVNLSTSSFVHATNNGSSHRSLEDKETYIVTFNNKEDRQDFVDSNPFGEIKSVFARGNSISIDLDTSEYADIQKNTLISNIAIDEIIQLPPFVPTGAGLSSNITVQDTEVSSSINPLEVPYGINLVNALDVSDEFAEDMTVCVCDTGFDLGHPDLQVDVDGMSFVNETWSIDGNSHG